MPQGRPVRPRYRRRDMCGIGGAWRVATPDLEPALQAALAALRHRGPDGQGLHVEPGVALGMRRLAIIDVAGGQQPLWNETDDVGVVLNGEIYTYVELLQRLAAAGHRLRTRSDTETLVHLYEDEGDAFVHALRGMFAFALFDRPRRRLLLGRDRFGKKPLYYARTPGGGLVYASELKALRPLLAAAGVAVEVDDQAIYDFLSLGAVPQPRTAFRGVRALPPGTLLVADDEGVREERYWTPAFEPKLQLGYGEAQARVRDAVAEAVRIRLRSDVPLGAFLSGGVDSTIVAFEAARAVGGTLRTFTVGSDDPAVDESAVAARTAGRLGVQHTLLRLDVDPLRDLAALVRQYDQPFADPSAIPSLAVSRAAREHVTVVLNGDGGDELFGGYRRYVAARATEALGWVPAPAAAWLGARLAGGARRSAAGFAARLLRGLALPPEERYLVWTGDMLRDADKRPAWRRPGTPVATEALVATALASGLRGLDRQVAAEVALNLPSALLVKMDVATSAASLEGRSPFLDQEVAALALRLPAAYRVRGRRTKAILRDAYADALGDEVARGAKRGFEVPLARWLAHDWRDVVGDTLGAPDARVLGYVDPALVARARAADGFPDRNRAYVAYAFLVLELWLRSLEA